MKQKFFILLVLLIGCFSAFANPVDIPSYEKNYNKKCGCDCDGRILFEQLPINNKNLKRWAKEAAVYSYTYGFGNYHSALKNAAEYFTARGWENFSNALQASGNLSLVIEKHLRVYAKPYSTSVIRGKFLMDGKEAWEIEVPLQVFYEGMEGTSQQLIKVNLVLVENPKHPGTRGLGVNQFIVKNVRS